jgi:hypothetical protein
MKTQCCPHRRPSKMPGFAECGSYDNGVVRTQRSAYAFASSQLAIDR